MNVPSLTEEEFATFQKLVGNNIDKKILELLKFAASASPTNTGDSGLDYETLPEKLPKMAEEKTPPESMPETVFISFKRFLGDELQRNLKDLEPLATVSAFKWIESLETLFKTFDHAKLILTTTGYEKAIFERNSLKWSRFLLEGNQVISDALEALEKEIVNYLKQKKTLVCLQNLSKITVHDIWSKATELSEDAVTEPYAAYLDEMIHRWNTMTGTHPNQIVNLYMAEMKRRYESSFVQFMENQGYGMVKMWQWWKGTSLAKVILESLDEQYREHRVRKDKIDALTSWNEKSQKSDNWKKGLRDNLDKTGVEIEERNKRSIEMANSAQNGYGPPKKRHQLPPHQSNQSTNYVNPNTRTLQHPANANPSTRLPNSRP
ncbi:hypothetical protein OY671_007357 [Metschnikowia pulcherrima]|nr:hypothetical protein OY671_007357 [Metschnikowia pulcherrima]